jgi:hypothetical protein
MCCDVQPRFLFRALAPILLVASFGLPASADVTPEAKARAQLRFQEGEKAYREGDFRHAAEAFDAAYREVQHHVPLFNAARAWQKAGDRARAATDYDRFLDIAPAQDQDRPTATTALKQLSAELGQFQIARDDIDSVRVDGADVDGARVFVAPGSHEIEGRKGDKIARRTEKIAAAEVVRVRLALPKSEPSSPPLPDYVTPAPVPALAAPGPAPALATSRVPEAPRKSGWSPTVVYVEAGVTGLATLLTIWSGLNTVAYKHGDFAANETGETLGEGLYRERRTNVLLGTTIALGIVTGITALFLVDWTSKSDTKVGAR